MIMKLLGWMLMFTRMNLVNEKCCLLHKACSWKEITKNLRINTLFNPKSYNVFKNKYIVQSNNQSNERWEEEGDCF